VVGNAEMEGGKQVARNNVAGAEKKSLARLISAMSILSPTLAQAASERRAALGGTLTPLRMRQRPAWSVEGASPVPGGCASHRAEQLADSAERLVY
jgi:hypothetical protein